MSDQDTYYVRRRGRIDGPWTVDKLHAEVKLRKLGRHHELSIDNLTWFRAGELSDLFPRLDVKKRVRELDYEAIEELAEQEGELELEPPVEDEWFCAINNEQHGPMTLAELKQIVFSGQCALDDLVWREGFAEWVPAERVPELASPTANPFDRREVRDNNDHEQETRLIDLPPKSASMATASAILAGVLLPVSWIPVLGMIGIVPIVMSLFALREIGDSDGQVGGTGYAITGIVLGILDLGVAFVVAFVGITWWVSK